jgi:hypothetical protein
VITRVLGRWNVLKDRILNSNEEQLVVETQEIQEEHIIVSFDFPKTQGTPWTRALILRQLGFGVVAIIQMSHDEA